jgi:hypothetical protein
LGVVPKALSKASPANFLRRDIFNRGKDGMGRKHDFTNIHWGQEFALTAPLETVKATATGQGALESGDCIILSIQCRVDEVEYYINAPDIWQAKISFEKPISLETISPNNSLQPVQKLIEHFKASFNQCFNTLSTNAARR